LQALGVIKKGFALDNDALQCSAIFTGKHNINTIDGLLQSESLQQQLMHDITSKTIAELKAQGVVTGNESTQELAAIAGMATKYSTANIKDFLLGLLTGPRAALKLAMDALGKLAAIGALITAVKNSDVLGKLKGFGAKLTSIPTLAKNTIDTAETDAGVDQILGDIPSSDAPEDAGPVNANLLTEGDY